MMADEEIRLIDDKSWSEPLLNPALEIKIEMPVRNDTRPRLDASVLPKYIHYETNLDPRLASLESDVRLYGEELVCVAIPRYCFEDGNMVRQWYDSLGGPVQGFIGKGAGCWVRFKEAFRNQWALPMGLAVKGANIQAKRLDETFLEFFYANLALLESAYPQNPAEAHIEMSKYCLDDPLAMEWAKEAGSLSIVKTQLRDYDNHLKRYPTLLVNAATNRIKPTPGYAAHQKGATTSGEKAPLNVVRVKRSPEEILSLNKERAASLAVRTNDKGEKVISFGRKVGTLVFLRDPCSICKNREETDSSILSYHMFSFTGDVGDAVRKRHHSRTEIREA